MSCAFPIELMWCYFDELFLFHYYTSKLDTAVQIFVNMNLIILKNDPIKCVAHLSLSLCFHFVYVCVCKFGDERAQIWFGGDSVSIFFLISTDFFIFFPEQNK